jgi:hypothetical protein
MPNTFLAFLLLQKWSKDLCIKILVTQKRKKENLGHPQILPPKETTVKR